MCEWLRNVLALEKCEEKKKKKQIAWGANIFQSNHLRCLAKNIVESNSSKQTCVYTRRHCSAWSTGFGKDNRTSDDFWKGQGGFKTCRYLESSLQSNPEQSFVPFQNLIDCPDASKRIYTAVNGVWETFTCIHQAFMNLFCHIWHIQQHYIQLWALYWIALHRLDRKLPSVWRRHLVVWRRRLSLPDFCLQNNDSWFQLALELKYETLFWPLRPLEDSPGSRWELSWKNLPAQSEYVQVLRHFFFLYCLLIQLICPSQGTRVPAAILNPSGASLRE